MMALDAEEVEENDQSLSKQGTCSLPGAAGERSSCSQLNCTDFLGDAFWSLLCLAAVHKARARVWCRSAAPLSVSL